VSVTATRTEAAVRVRRGLTPLHAVAALAAFIALLPLLYLAVRTVDAGWAAVWEVLTRPRTWETAVRSLGLAVAVAAACVVIGVPTAWLVTRSDLRGRRVWAVLVALPLAVPSFVAAYAWVALFPGFSGFWASFLVLTVVSTPYVVLPVAAALRSADPAVEEVARSLGRNRWEAFRRATLPQVTPAAAAGSLLVALYVLSDFGAVSTLRYDAFTRVIYASYRASFDRTAAAVLSVVLVLLALMLVLAEQRARGRARRHRVGSGASRSPEVVPLQQWQVPAQVWLGGLSILALGIPFGVLIGFTATRGLSGLAPGEVLAATAATAGVSAIGAVMALILAVPVGVLAARYRDRWARAIESGAYIGHALPGVVVGLALVFVGLAVAPGLYQTVFMVGFAYAVLFLPNAAGSVRSAVAAVPPVLEQVGRSLGRGPFTTWRTVTLPVAWPGVAAGGTLVLLTAMKELPATLMLRPTGMDTLATEVWTRTEIAAYSEVAPFALVLVLVAALPAWWLSRALSPDAAQATVVRA
jgi:iron(III) transport system permease protein